MKRALITGIGGQDGAYLAQYLLDCGYEVHGTSSRAEGPFTNLDALGVHDRIRLIGGDLSDTQQHSVLRDWVETFQYDEIYNLAAISSVAESFGHAARVQEVNGGAFVRLLQCVRDNSPQTRVFQASSSEMFGTNGYHDETSPLRPVSPYGASKAYAHHMARIYREAYGVWVACGILFNHESVFRRTCFIMRKITSYAALTAAYGAQELLVLHTPGVSRDWGYACDYVKAMHAMLQPNTPRDYVIATGNEHTVLDIAKHCANRIGVNLKDFVDLSSVQSSDRPLDVPRSYGNPSLIREGLRWSATLQFEDLIDMLLHHDMRCVDAEHG